MILQRLLGLSLSGVVFLAGSGLVRSAETPQYNRDIRPILAENCFACHGPDSAARKADLRLDRREDAIKSGAINPGKPEESALLERVLETEPARIMPPPKSHKKLTAAQKDTLRRWIASGAEYQVHWSFLRPERPALPAVKNPAWCRNPIDRFILAQLEQRGLTPAPEADRRTLARRLSLDLTGLPPEPPEVEAFVADTRPDAYERYVDHLLKSPQWGEHRGRYWLDAARYADTHGIHFDNFREVWAYRDWVINAFNRNLPFDQFTIEQLAGDLLPNRTLEQQVASGFNRCNITTNEGGVIPEEYLVLYTRDRTETVSQVWLGLTTGCAVCHDHKFDPLSQREFYQLAAFFNNTTQGAMDGNIRDTPPIITVPSTLDRQKWDALTGRIEGARKEVAERKKAARVEFDNWSKQAAADFIRQLMPTANLQAHVPLTEEKGQSLALTVGGQVRTVTYESGFDWTAGKEPPKAFTLRPGSSVEIPEAGDFDKNEPFTCATWVRIPKRGQVGSVLARMDNTNGHRGWDMWMEADKIGIHLINKWPDDALKVVSKTPLQPGRFYHVVVSYDGSGKAGGVRIFLDGNPQAVDVATDRLQGTTRTKVPLKLGQRHTADRLQGVSLKDVRIYGRSLADDEIQQLARGPRALELATKPVDKRTAKENDELYDWWLVTLDEPYRTLNARLAGLQQEEVALKSRGTIAHVMQEKPEPAMAYILHRGEYDKRRDPVKPDTPKVLPPFEASQPRTRLGLANWLLRPDQPLPARVTVNRFWQEVFGTGIVRTSGDFGVTGELPSHPELLDWLALEFRDTGWDMKRFFKLLVTSATYRQAAATTPLKLEKDPQNRLLSRGPRFRMDAEMIRDHALAASGLLVKRLGGPSVKPYQPEGVWEAVAMIGSNTRDYRPDRGSNLYRRSMYTFWKRSAPPASMDILNAPSREFCTVRRERTNTPLQALVTLNDPQFVEAARYLAEQALKAGGDDENSRLDFVARRLVARPLRAEEQTVVQSSLKELQTWYQTHADEARKLITVGESKPDSTLDPSTLAAWTMVVNELMNLDEVLNK